MESTPQPYSVLIVDDSAEIRILWKRRMEKLGFKNIALAENGTIAIDKTRTLMPHIILLDFIMPEKDGLEVLREIRTFHPSAVVIVTSSISERGKIVELKNAKADMYYLKTASQEKFFETISKATSLLHARFPEIKP